MLLGEKVVEAILQRLDRLTLEEAPMAALKSFEVVYYLFQNMTDVLGGE